MIDLHTEKMNETTFDDASGAERLKSSGGDADEGQGS